MKTSLIRLVVPLVAIPLILLLGVFGYVQFLETRNQQVLRDQIKRLGEQKIVHVEISTINRTVGKVEKKILRHHEITLLQIFLKYADIAPIGGHNRPMYECSLTFTLEGNVTLHFSGTVFSEYDWNKHDLYLTESTQDSKPVRIINLGKWIMENGPKNQEQENGKSEHPQ